MSNYNGTGPPSLSPLSPDDPAAQGDEWAALCRRSGRRLSKRKLAEQAATLKAEAEKHELNLCFPPGYQFVETAIFGKPRPLFRAYVSKCRRLGLGIFAPDLTRIIRPEDFHGTENPFAPFKQKHFDWVDEIFEGVPLRFAIPFLDPLEIHKAKTGLGTYRGMAKAKAEGKQFGRPPKKVLEDERLMRLLGTLNDLEISDGLLKAVPDYRGLAKETGIPRSTIGRILSEEVPTTHRSFPSGMTVKDAIREFGAGTTYRQIRAERKLAALSEG